LTFRCIGNRIFKMKNLSSTDYVIINTKTLAPLVYFHSGEIILYSDKKEALDDSRIWDEAIIPCTDLSYPHIRNLIQQINKY